MFLVTVYGILVLMSLAIAIAAKTCTLWKVGLLLFMNYSLINIFNFIVKNPIDGIVFSTIYLFSFVTSFHISKKYKCQASATISLLLLLSMCFSSYYAFNNEYLFWARANNILFIFQCVILITSSINRILSRTRRHVKLGPRGEERRNRPYTYRLKDLFWREHA